MNSDNAIGSLESASIGSAPPVRSSLPDLVCLSHLRWDFVFQRPQHLLTRCGRERRVIFVEEPIFSADPAVRMDVTPRGDVTVAVPRLPEGMAPEEVILAQRALLDSAFADLEVNDYILWYYTPMALDFTRHLRPQAVVYDCMDELSAFKNAPPVLTANEAELFERADVVFTGGQSLYEAKRDRHSNIHAFPSSIDYDHFSRARESVDEPADQASIPHPRIGFFGVVDERFDIELLAGVATARPDWQLVIIGPVVKIDPATLPRAANIHYLGGKSYEELPAYLAGWDVAMLAFARNESTRYISPTKTPEYLAAGKPVISTSIRDVVRPYGELGLVRIADTAEGFVEAAEALLGGGADDEWLERVDAFLAQTSWDRTWSAMRARIDEAVERRAADNAGRASGDAAQSVAAGVTGQANEYAGDMNV